MALATGIDPTDLSQTGWGIMFPEGGDPSVERALEPLLNFRREQAHSRFRRFYYKKGESAPQFLWYRHGVAPGVLDTSKMPFYLLLIGDFDEIPFSFQTSLNGPLAMGRLSLEHVADYTRYAQSVVAWEQDRHNHQGRAAFFVVQNDIATSNFSRTVATPLIQAFQESTSHLAIETYSGEYATKTHLVEALSEESSPLRFLFVSSHGVTLPAGHENQSLVQGAIVCQDWPGGSRIQKEHYFAASDVPESANISGMIAFLLEDFSGATDMSDKSLYLIGQTEPSHQAHERPFVARLPRRLLGHPRGGALAILARCGRSWLYSDDSSPKHLNWLRMALEDYILSLTQGFPIGYAHKNLAHTSYEFFLSSPSLFEGSRIPPTQQEQFALSWAIGSDARNFMILGDPAVRLPRQ